MYDTEFLCVTLPMPPTHNNSLIPIRKGRLTTMVMSDEARQWFAKADSILAPLHGVFTLWPGIDVGVFVECFFNSARRDVDSCQKKAMDALEGHAYTNDRQVKWQGSAAFSTDEEEACIVVRVWKIGECPDHVRNLIGGYM